MPATDSFNFTLRKEPASHCHKILKKIRRNVRAILRGVLHPHARPRQDGLKEILRLLMAERYAAVAAPRPARAAHCKEGAV